MDRRLRLIVSTTMGLTFALLVLGVYTAASGAGLACSARWPLCNGAVFGLFPANWPSFVEWFHRLVAAITGGFILASTATAWRLDGSRRVRVALTVAAVVLPTQIVLGGLTVARYEWLILAAHFVTALVIFTGVALATFWGVSGRTGSAGAGGHRTGARWAAAVAVAALVPVALLTPRVLFVFDATVQVAYYAAGLAAYGALLAVAVWTDGRPRVLAGSAAAVLFALLVLGRQTYGELLQVAGLVGTAVAFLLAVGVAWWLHRLAGPEDGTIDVVGSD